MPKFFFEKRVLVTGGARGLGRALVDELIRQGAHVIVVDKHEPSLEQLKRDHPLLVGFSGDLLSRSLREEVKNWLIQTGGLDVLINNAGIVHGGEFLKVDLNQHQQTLQVNLGAPLDWSHELLPLLLLKKNSRLWNIASASALVGFPLASSYSASKWGVLGFSESLSLELRNHPSGIQVGVACPSYIRTELFQGAEAPLFTKTLDAQKLASQILDRCAGGRFFFTAPPLAKLIPLVKSLLPHSWWEGLITLLGIHRGMQKWRPR
jgi:all-trans-retinol dehydrogenase (NAD+)